MEKFSLTDIKKMNYSDVYHYIYTHDCCSKQNIATDLRMSLPTVSQHLNALTEQGLIQISGQLKSQIGRKAAAYSIIPNAKLAFGVEILKDHTFIVAINLLGEIIGQNKISQTFKTSEDYYSSICTSILELMNAMNVNVGDVLGAGFGLQGLVSNDGQTILYGKILNCTNLSIDAFAKHLPFPCRFIHDSECAALCDMWNNPNISDALYLSVGRHLGGALILNGEISVGRTGRSGTFEHMTLVPNGKRCYCGQNGCMECYCSIQALLEDYPADDIDVFFQNKSIGEADASRKWEAFLTYLAASINNLHMVIDCDIVIGGHIAPYLTPSDILTLHKLVQEQTAFPETDCFLIQGGQLKEAVTIGAALPFIKEFLAKI